MAAALRAVDGRAGRGRGAGLFLALGMAASAFGQVCAVGSNATGSASFGTINPALTTPATFSVSMSFSCTAGAAARFTVTGLNDTGPGAHRLKHATHAHYLPYTVSAIVVSGNNVTLRGQILAADYRNAYSGPYSDAPTLLLLP